MKRQLDACFFGLRDHCVEEVLERLPHVLSIYRPCFQEVRACLGDLPHIAGDEGATSIRNGDVGARPARAGHPVIGKNLDPESTHGANLFDDLVDLLVSPVEPESNLVDGGRIFDGDEVKAPLFEEILVVFDRLLAPRSFVALLWLPATAPYRLKHREVVLATVQDAHSVIDTRLLDEFPRGLGPRGKKLTQFDHGPPSWAKSIGNKKGVFDVECEDVAPDTSKTRLPWWGPRGGRPP